MNIGKPFSAVRRLFIPSLFLIALYALPGCGGEDAPQSHTDTIPHAAAAAPAHLAAPAIVEDSATDSIPGAATRTVPTQADNVAAQKKETGKKLDSLTSAKTAEKEKGTPQTRQVTTAQGGTQAAQKGTEKTGESKEEKSGCADATPELQQQGRMVFIGKGNCGSCHGYDGKGQVLGPDLTDGKWLHINGSYPTIAGIVRTGVNLVVEYPSPMPPMGGSRLTDEEICAVAAYVWSLSH